jgi:hypothetical protein
LQQLGAELSVDREQLSDVAWARPLDETLLPAADTEKSGVSTRRPSAREIAEQDRVQLLRQQALRTAADAVTSRFALFAEVERVALFGSVARQLAREVPRFQPYRRLGIELLHECKDVDLAVWITNLTGLRDLGRARQ